MTDVRLTALNPEDSTVVPVACNSSGELLVDKGAQGPDLNIEGDLSVGGSASFAGRIDAATSEPNNYAIVATNNTNNSTASLLVKNKGTGWLLDLSGATGNVVSVKNDGSASFANSAAGAYTFISNRPAAASFCISGGTTSNTGDPAWYVTPVGSATFTGDVVVGSRSKSWMLVEQGGLCHMVEQTRSLVDEGFSVDADADYPKLRDVFNELDLVEKSLSQVMEKLRLTPPAGWPVWDGSDETQ